MKITSDDFLTALKNQAMKNDGKVSKKEAHIIKHVERMNPTANPLAIYVEVLKAAYQDGKLSEDECDLVVFARDFLKITDKDHLLALTTLRSL